MFHWELFRGNCPSRRHRDPFHYPVIPFRLKPFECRKPLPRLIFGFDIIRRTDNFDQTIKELEPSGFPIMSSIS